MWECMYELCGDAWMNYVGMHEEREEERKHEERRGGIERREEKSTDVS